MQILLFVLQAVLAVALFVAGGSKLVGVRQQRDNFERWGYSAWFRQFVGVYEVAAAALLAVGFVVPLAAAFGAGMLVVSFIGAALTHLRAGDPKHSVVPAGVLWLMAVIVLAGRWASAGGTP